MQLMTSHNCLNKRHFLLKRCTHQTHWQHKKQYFFSLNLISVSDFDEAANKRRQFRTAAMPKWERHLFMTSQKVSPKRLKKL